MLTVISGMIGAGKSTYAEQRFLHVTDCDYAGSKTEQIRQTLRWLEAGESAAHITCFPTPEEMAVFSRIPDDQIEYLWINTDQEQCRKNVLKRGRLSDLRDLSQIWDKNHWLYSKYCRSKLPWKEITIFEQEQEERW